MRNDQWRQQLVETVLGPLARPPRRFYLVVLLLLGVIGWGLYAYSVQLRQGLAVTGMATTTDRIMWGFYIINFVFFIGISHAGTLISAILRVSKARWRLPVTRMAEFITVVALSVGALMPIIDLGRPDRALSLFIYGRFQSPIVWDLLSITTYLTGSFIYLYLPLIPDLALCRDVIGERVSPLKRAFYRIMSVGWVGAEGQKRKLTVALGMMMILIIPVAVSVHTVVSWIFAMTLRTGWDSTVFGAYFVAGAIFSGIATILIVMAILRKIYHLEQVITQQHFVNLAYMMGAFTLIMMYFNASEYVTAGYKMEEGMEFYLTQVFVGSLAPNFWFYTIGGMVVPGLIILNPRTRTIPWIVFAAVLVDIAMWMERYIIVVGGLRTPLMPYAPATYTPTWIEWSIMAGAFALFALIITLFTRLVPLVSVWEVVEHGEEEHAPAHEATPALAPQTQSVFRSVEVRQDASR